MEEAANRVDMEYDNSYSCDGAPNSSTNLMGSDTVQGNISQLSSSITSSAGIEGKPTKRKSCNARAANGDTDCHIDQLIQLLHGSDPVKMELARLENELKDKDRELVEARAETKAVKVSERMKEKALEELAEELEKLDKKLKATEILLDNKNLEVKRINDEKKAALAAQIAAEANLRRVQAAQKDEDLPPIEAILAPLEADLKLARQEIVRLQENNRALERLTKSKEAALVEAVRTVEAAEAKAAIVDDLQNQNQDLLRKIESWQEDNKCLDKMHRQKVAEIEKLSTTVVELQEAVAAGGAAHVNTARDYQRQVHELSEGKKTLERELARAKISANRVATVVANSWKDSEDKLMPVKQWLDERRVMQGEIQKLRDKLAAMERSTKNELQLKDKLHLRMKVLEEALRVAGCSSNGSSTPRNASSDKGGSQFSAILVNNNGFVGHPSAANASEEAAAAASSAKVATVLLTSSSSCSTRNQLSAMSQLRGSMALSSATRLLSKNQLRTLISKSLDGGRSLDAPAESSPAAAVITVLKSNFTSGCQQPASMNQHLMKGNDAGAAVDMSDQDHKSSVKLQSMMSKGPAPGAMKNNSSEHPSQIPTRNQLMRSSKLEDQRTKKQVGCSQLRSNSSTTLRSHIVKRSGPCRIVPVSVPGLITNFIPASF